MFTLKIETANAAFDEMGEELARVLRELADQIELKPWRSSDYRDSRKGMTRDEGTLRDVNGNTVGRWEWTA